MFSPRSIIYCGVEHGMRTVKLVFLLLLLLALPQLAQHTNMVHAQTENSTTTTEPTVSISNVTVYRFNTTTISIGIENSTHLILSYACLYENSTSDCCKIQIEVYDENMSLLGTYDFINFTEMCTLNGLCSKVVYIPYGNNTKITYKIYRYYNSSYKVLLKQDTMIIPFSPVKMTGYMGILATLIPIAILIKLAGRGSVKDVGLGLILFGVSLLMIGYLGIYTNYMYLAFVASVLVGILLVYNSRS